VLAPIGSLIDKIALLPLIFTVRTKSIQQLFKETETDTFTALTEKWGFSDVILGRFFRPFLEGIYLAPLEEQSSLMFSFIFKMFSEGAATLPEGGMGAIARQLVDKANAAGTDIRVGQIVTKISQNADGYLVETLDGKTRIQANSVIVATDVNVAQKIISQLEGFQSLESLPPPKQREVGCLYYSFASETPVNDPILILNGIGDERGNEENPVNNVCFPSAVAKGYAPEGCGLCSVTILKDAMDTFKGREDELDQAVRKQLATWFPEQKEDILNTWELKRVYNIPNAQPVQYKGPFPANVDGGRACTTYRGKDLPPGLFVCGDHMATATLNGALESGVNAGMAAATALK
jgi:phytoene dehydrogenase-like protein